MRENSEQRKVLNEILTMTLLCTLAAEEPNSQIIVQQCKTAIITQCKHKNVT